MDHIGAIIGLLTFSAVFFLKGEYQTGLGILLIPALVTIAVLAVARSKVPAPEGTERFAHVAVSDAGGRLPRAFWL
jgi:uncharacterized membrane protein YccC